MVDPKSPQAQVAEQFMRDKGLDIQPYDVQKLDDQPCWYFLYRLPEGILELEVSWDDSARDWVALVTTFTLAS